MNRTEEIQNGKVWVGIEFGSTRIKAVLIGADYVPLASGVHDWCNQLEGGIWTYSLDAVRQGLQASFADLMQNVQKGYGVPLTTAADETKPPSARDPVSPMKTFAGYTL